MFILLSICLSWFGERCLLWVDTCSLNGYIIQDPEEKCKSSPTKFQVRTEKISTLGIKKKKSLLDQREKLSGRRSLERHQGRSLGR